MVATRSQSKTVGAGAASDTSINASGSNAAPPSAEAIEQPQHTGQPESRKKVQVIELSSSDIDHKHAFIEDRLTNLAGELNSTSLSATKKAPSKARGTAAKGKAKRKASPPSKPTALELTAGQSTSILDLPAELRNEIWTMLLLQQAPIDVALARPFLKEPALLAVNRQIRSETMSIWYAEHSFQIMGSNPAVKFLRSRDDQQLRSMRSLCITTEKSPDMVHHPQWWLHHLRSKVETLMREFESRGLRRWALKFQVQTDGQLKWINGDELQDFEVAEQGNKVTRIEGGPRKGQRVVRAVN